MAEVAAIGFFLGQIMEIVGPLLLAKHCAEVGNDLVHRRRPKIKNIVAILMGGFEIVDPDILPTEAFTDKLSNFVVKNFHYIDPAVTPAIIAEGKGSAIDMLAELRKLISENPDIIGFKYGEIVLNPEQFNASKALLTTLLQGPVELGVDGVEAFAFKQLINSLSGESSTDEDIGNIFTVTMLPFIDHCKQLFSKMDKDKNGYISKDELKPWLANFSDRTGVSVRGADSIFSSLDKDQDGKIDFAEFISWQFIIYLHQTHKYCDSCKRCFIEGAEGNKCIHSTTGQHITKHAKNYPCAHTTHKHVNLPYSVCSICHSSCSSNGNTACYYCVKCDHTVCLECEEINGKGYSKLPPILHKSNIGRKAAVATMPDTSMPKGIQRIVLFDPNNDPEGYFSGFYCQYGSKLVRSYNGNIWGLVPMRSDPQKFRLVRFGITTSSLQVWTYYDMHFTSNAKIVSDHNQGVWINDGIEIWHLTKQKIKKVIDLQQNSECNIVHDMYYSSIYNSYIWVLEVNKVDKICQVSFISKSGKLILNKESPLLQYDVSQMKIAMDEVDGIWMVMNKVSSNTTVVMNMQCHINVLLQSSIVLKEKYDFGTNLLCNHSDFKGISISSACKGCFISTNSGKHVWHIDWKGNNKAIHSTFNPLPGGLYNHIQSFNNTIWMYGEGGLVYYGKYDLIVVWSNIPNSNELSIVGYHPEGGLVYYGKDCL